MKRLALLIACLLLYVAPGWATCSNTQFGRFKCIVSTVAKSSDNTVVTTSSIDTTGADLIVIVVAADKNNAPVLTDSKVNTSCWTALTGHSAAGTFAKTTIYYCQSPIVGSGHTFTLTLANSFPCIAVAALSGSGLSPFDVQDGNTGAGVSTLPAGATGITPGSNNELVVTGINVDDSTSTLTIDSGYTLTDSTLGSGTAFGCGIALLGQGTAAATNPTWSYGGVNNDPATSIASFKPLSTTISRHGQCSATATNCTLSAVATNDLVISFAFRSGSVTPPTNPGGETSIQSAATSASGTVGSYQVSCRLGASFSDTTSGTFANATAVAAIAFTGARYDTTANCATNSLGVKATNNAKASTTADYPALAAFTGVSGTSWIVAFDGDSASSHCTPTGLTQETSTGTVAGKDSEATKTSWSDLTCSVTSGTWMTWIAEVMNSKSNAKATNDTSGTGSGAASEFSARSAGATRLANDSVNGQISDLSSRIFGAKRPVFDYGVSNYYYSRTYTGVRSVFDSGGSADISLRVYGTARSATEASGTLEVLSRIVSSIRAPFEVAALFDTATRVNSLTRAAADISSGNEVNSRSVASVRSLFERLSSSDLSGRLATATRSVVDSASYANESVARIATLSRVASDTSINYETGARMTAIARSASDLASTYEAATRLATVFRTVTERSLTPEVGVRSVTSSRSSYEVSLSLDQISRLVSNTRSVFDSYAISDIGDRVLLTGRQYTELVYEVAALSESAARQTTVGRQAFDANLGYDSGTRSVSMTRLSSDILAGSDKTQRGVGFTRAIADQMAAMDISARSVSALRNANDLLYNQDRPTRIGTFGRSVSDAAGVSDTMARSLGFRRGVFDSLVAMPVDADAVIGHLIGAILESHKFVVPPRNSQFIVALRNTAFSANVKDVDFSLTNRVTDFRLSSRVTNFIYLGR